MNDEASTRAAVANDHRADRLTETGNQAPARKLEKRANIRFSFPALSSYEELQKAAGKCPCWWCYLSTQAPACDMRACASEAHYTRARDQRRLANARKCCRTYTDTHHIRIHTPCAHLRPCVNLTLCETQRCRPREGHG